MTCPGCEYFKGRMGDILSIEVEVSPVTQLISYNISRCSIYNTIMSRLDVTK
jgi:hypothetical protein